MRNKISKLLVIMLALIMVVSIVGCGKTATDETDVSTATEATAEVTEAVKEPVKLKISLVYPEGHGQYPVVRSTIDDFVTANPHVTIEEDLLPSESFADKMKIAYATDELPDIFTIWPGAKNPELINAGKWLNLAPYLDADPEWKAGFNGGTLETYQYEGIEGTYGLPFGMFYVGMYYNKDLFAAAGAEVPNTWDELLVTIEKLKASGVVPWGIGAKDLWRGEHLFSNLLIKSSEVGTMQKLADREISYNSDAVINAFAKIKELIDVEAFGPNALALGYGEEVADFFAEKTAIRFSGSWTVGEVTGADAPEGFGEKIGVFEFPSFTDHPEGNGIWFGGVNDTIALSNTMDENQIEAAVAFAKLFTSSEVAKKFVEDTKLISAIKADVDPEKAGALLAEFSRVLTTAKGFTGEIPAYEKNSTVLEMVYNLSQEIMGGATTPEEAAKRLADEAAKE